MKILKLSKDTLDKFNDKFDWSKGKQTKGYSAPAEGVLEIGEPVDETQPVSTESETPSETQAEKQKFSFDDIDF